MARSRDYQREYRARLAKAERLGRSRQAGRGHGATPERPERAARRPWLYPAYFEGERAQERLARIDPGALAEWNLMRALEGKHELSASDPGAQAGRRQMFGSFEAAESWLGTIPVPYVTIYPEGGAWAARIQRAA